MHLYIGGRFPCTFSKIGKNCANLEKKCPDCGHLWVKFLKYPNFKKTPLPYKILSYAPVTDHEQTRARSRLLQMFSRIGVLKNFSNFTWKHLCWILFLIKSQAFRHFPLKFQKFLRTTFFLQNTSDGCFWYT